MPSILAETSQGHVADLAEGKAGRDTIEPPVPTAALGKSASSLGKKDAPVDGKDGRPHQGPFIETEAERDRKKAKESGDHPTGASGSPSKPLSKEGWGDKAKDMDLPSLPKSNDGVMDDRNREGPKEGTRGTEGGISEKSKGKSSAEDGEKTPEEPKAAPPLPHSEQEKMGSDSSKSSKEAVTTPVPKAEDEKDKDKAKDGAEDTELGGISVRAASNSFHLSSN